ncbi:MAG: alpha-1,4-glucan--maltose-1-phosphate maltosyltransferase [Propionibacteriaceae bacterium]|jgi:starch synthase (maltosyl-transferring)|nr:alpha-1,4-glucan--maltose-1-phosphate maltosyltransferase [Propionibacteriaceae bacterium]
MPKASSSQPPADKPTTTTKAAAKSTATTKTSTKRTVKKQPATARKSAPKPEPLVVGPLVPGLPRGIGRIPVVKLEPVIEGGVYPAKAVAGEQFPIRARVFREGHDTLAATVVLTAPDGRQRSFAMAQIWPEGLDIFETQVRADTPGAWTFRVEGWADPWGTWRHNAAIKLPAGIDLDLVRLEGEHLLARTLAVLAIDHPDQADTLDQYRPAFASPIDLQALTALLDDTRFIEAITTHPIRDLVSPTADFPLLVERPRALFSSWYEMFPRSQGAHQREGGSWVSGTFDTASARLDAIAAMGFDIVYLPPIHPIGAQFRKGKDNTLTPGPGDPGSPWAVGGAEGGHDAIHPDLGGFDAFARFVDHAHDLGLEVALDFALQVSPDHPWVKDHPDWFSTRADGSIAYAENPPKKYQDIYPINFDQDRDGLYRECLRLLEFWIGKGVTIFRVDNPHTKPVEFWAWLMAQMRERHPEVIFLAEAFTRPEMMHALGKVGFQQSYSYFVWRTAKWELEEYLKELAHDTAAFYRPNFFVNTPDINPYYLQGGNHAAFAIRAILAATMSPSWGMYSGFEIFEHEPLPGREEYAHSEKYEYRPRDYDDKPNLNELITVLNQVRREHPALQTLRTIHFHEASNDQVIVYSKREGKDRVIVVVSLDPITGQDAMIHLDFAALGLPEASRITVHDALTGNTWTWGRDNFVSLYPAQPAHILLVRD